ncbi:hypothetical protein [uncultured Methylobacterium sp.]|jgi:hypothetical protein|uniref:hypothetical protein n=1 Tax=uncultured Methylobacterium sp. TaxID=157278 RepID=UPI00261B2F5D|nr:hypothetical protein [uncultured Methylobacterium sp.]
MSEDDVQTLNAARRRLVARQVALARSIAGSATVAMAEVHDLTAVTVAIEHLDRTLVDLGRPHMPGNYDDPG